MRDFRTSYVEYVVEATAIAAVFFFTLQMSQVKAFPSKKKLSEWVGGCLLVSERFLKGLWMHQVGACLPNAVSVVEERHTGRSLPCRLAAICSHYANMLVVAFL